MKPKLKETDYTKMLRDWITVHGCYVEKRHADKFTGKGKPDLFIVDKKSHKFFEIEVKTDVGRLSDAQKAWLENPNHTWMMLVSRPKTFEQDQNTIIEWLKKTRGEITLY
jgi:hypothetical protein